MDDDNFIESEASALLSQGLQKVYLVKHEVNQQLRRLYFVDQFAMVLLKHSLKLADYLLDVQYLCGSVKNLYY